MKYNGSFNVLNSNPADLHVYRKRQHHANTTPGVEQPLVVLHFYKHVMPPASLFTRKNRANEMEYNGLNTGLKQTAIIDFTTGLNILNRTRNTKYSLLTTQY